jgi:hypothetical protein
VVPVLNFATATAVAADGANDEVKAVAGFTWTIKLPANVTCTSRSGVALKGRCPKASEAQP